MTTRPISSTHHETRREKGDILAAKHLFLAKVLDCVFGMERGFLELGGLGIHESPPLCLGGGRVGTELRETKHAENSVVEVGVRQSIVLSEALQRFFESVTLRVNHENHLIHFVIHFVILIQIIFVCNTHGHALNWRHGACKAGKTLHWPRRLLCSQTWDPPLLRRLHSCHHQNQCEGEKCRCGNLAGKSRVLCEAICTHGHALNWRHGACKAGKTLHWDRCCALPLLVLCSQ